MKDRIVQLVAFLKGSPEFTDVMGTGQNCRLFPLVAAEGTQTPFAIYTIGSVPLTKDAGLEFNAALQIFWAPNKFTEMVEFADMCTDLLNSEPDYNVGPVEHDYSKDYASLFTTIPFTID